MLFIALIIDGIVNSVKLIRDKILGWLFKGMEDS